MLRQAIEQGLIVEHPPVEVMLGDACRVTVKPYEVGDDVYLEVECNDGTIKSVLGNVDIDGNLTLKTDKATFATMVATACTMGVAPRLKKFLAGAVTVRRGAPLLR